MKWFLDTEFYERPGRLDLISIGLVSSTGKEFYAENAAFDWSLVPDDHWLQDNVRPHLGGAEAHVVAFDAALGELIRLEVGNKPEFWGWYCDYDWVAFCWLFGAMADLPEGFPMFCRDLRQRVAELHIDPSTVPAQDGTEHNALEDARWNKRVYDFLQQHVAEGGSVRCDGLHADCLRNACSGPVLCDGVALALDEIELAIWRGAKDKEEAPECWPEWLIGAALAVHDLLTQQFSGGQEGGVKEGWPDKPTLPELVAATIRRARGFEDEARPLANMLPNGASDDRIFEARGMQKVAENLRELLEEPTASTQPISDYKSGEGK